MADELKLGCGRGIDQQGAERNKERGQKETDFHKFLSDFDFTLPSYRDRGHCFHQEPTAKQELFGFEFL